MKNWKIGVFLLVLLAGVGVLGGYVLYDSVSSSDGSSLEGERNVYPDDEYIEEQKTTSRIMNAHYEENVYTLENPYVVRDPYGMSPLSALVRFQTDSPVRVTMTVEGEAPVTRTYEGYKEDHSLDILGLYPGRENTVNVQTETESGEVRETEITIETEPLPDSFLNTEIITQQKKKMTEGMTFLTPSEGKAFALDENNEVRWYASPGTSHVLERLENGNFAFLTTKVEQLKQYELILEMDMMGRVEMGSWVNVTNLDKWGIVHHDVIETPDGNFLATAHDGSGYIEDEMIEIDRESGEMVDSLNLKDIFPAETYEDYEGPSAEEGDWFHQNAIWYDKQNEAILVSSRHQSLIMSMDWPDGEVKWILGADEGWNGEMDEYVLEPTGEELDFPGGPHAPMTLPDQDDNPATTDILLFDNNITITRGEETTSEEYSRAVQYRVNGEEGTVEEVWEYGEERGEGFFSPIVGDADYLPSTDNRLLTSGYAKAETEDIHSRIVEVTEEKEVVFDLKIDGFDSGSHKQIYRADRMTLYPD